MCAHETSPIDPVRIKDSVKVLNTKKVKDRKPALTTSKCSPINLPVIQCTNSPQMEEWNIKCLPSDWEPNTTPSKAVRRLTKKHEVEHQQTIDEMRRQMSAVNVRLEDEIRKIADLYKTDSKSHREQMDEELNKIRIDYKQPNSVKGGSFQKLTENAYAAYRIIKNKLVKMDAEFRNLEFIRSDVFKKILQSAYAKVHEISHRLPFEIQEYFETEIQDINAVTLNNLRCYTELKMQLKLQLKNTLRLWLYEIFSLKEKWMISKRDLEFDTLNNSKAFTKKCKEIKKGNKEMMEMIMDTDFNGSLGSWSIRKAGPENLIDRVDGIEAICFEMDFCAQKLVGNFKEAVANVFSSYFCDLKNLSQKIIDLGLVDSSEIVDVKTEMCGQVVMDMTNEINDQYTKMQNLWSTLRQKLQSILQSTLVFLSSLAHVWDSHLLRIIEAKDAVSKNLEKVVDEGDLTIWAVESRINIAVDTLRQATDENQLYELMCEINRALDELQKIYQTNFNKECKITEKLQHLCVKEGEVLFAELEQFLFVFSQFDSCNWTDDDDDDEDTVQDESLLAMEIELCKKQIKNLVFFRNEAWNIMHKFTPICREENLEWAKQWIASECQKAELKLKVKLELVHVSRLGRTKPVVHDIRLAEIKEHRSRLRRHRAGIDVEIANVDLIYPVYEKKYDAVLEQYKEEVKKISERNDNATNAAVVSGNAALLKLATDSYAEKINVFNEEYCTKCQNELVRIFRSSLLYMKAIKLFSEGGSFNATESKSMCIELSKLRKIYKKRIVDMGKDNGNKFSMSLNEIRGIDSNLQLSLNKHSYEMHYNDHYKVTLQNIHIDVKREVFDLKLKRKILMGVIADVREKALDYLGVPDYVETFALLYDKVVVLCEDLHRVLSRTVPKNYVGDKFLQLNNTSTMSSMSTKSLLGREKSRHDNKNYAHFLFNVRPSEENNFIGKVRYLIYESFERLQDSAQEFYTKHSNAQLINDDKIYPSFGDFIVEVLPMHVYYHLQCEKVWLEETNEFVKSMNDFSQYLKRYFETFVHKYTDCVKLRLEKFHDSISSQIQELEKTDEDNFRKIYIKLKPLHGYPGNATMMSQLNDEMEEFLRSTDDERERPLASQKERLSSDCEKFKTDFKATIEKFELLISDFAEKSFRKEILDEFEQTLHYLENFLISNTICVVPDDAITTRAFERLVDYKTNVTIPTEYYVNLSSSFVNLSRNRVIEETKTMFDADAFVEDYERTVEKIANEIDAIEGTNRANFETWRNVWVADLERITKLYSVKYNLPKIN